MGLGELGGDRRGRIALPARCHLREVPALRRILREPEVEGMLNSPATLNPLIILNPLTTLNPLLHPLPAVVADDVLGLPGGEVAVAIEVVAEGDVDGIGRRGVQLERQSDRRRVVRQAWSGMFVELSVST